MLSGLRRCRLYFTQDQIFRSQSTIVSQKQALRSFGKSSESEKNIGHSVVKRDCCPLACADFLGSKKNLFFLGSVHLICFCLFCFGGFFLFFVFFFGVFCRCQWFLISQNKAKTCQCEARASRWEKDLIRTLFEGGGGKQTKHWAMSHDVGRMWFQFVKILGLKLRIVNCTTHSLKWS